MQLPLPTAALPLINNLIPLPFGQNSDLAGEHVGYGDHLPGGKVTIDVLNLDDGSTAWSWSPPPSKDSYGTGVNDVIATDNSLFVDTDIGV